MRKNIAVLFGAGAEIDYGLSAGADFAYKVLGLGPDSESLNNAINAYYKNRAETIDWYPEYGPTNWQEEKLLEAAVRKQLLDIPHVTKKNYDDDVALKIESLKTDPQKAVFISQHTSYMGIIDEAFHTLISPIVLGPRKFWRVVQAYTRAYAFLAGQLLFGGATPSEDDYNKILQDPQNTYAKLIEIARDKVDERSYYSVLKKYPNVNVITSNYTPLSKEIADKEVAYIHGRMDLFESAKDLTVYSVDQTSAFSNDILFPFISLQSGVKPIVCQQQIMEYAKMVDYLDKADVLLIVGFKLNVDDNHINSFIRSFYQSGKRILYFSFNSPNKEEVLEEVLRRLRLEDDKDGRVEIVEIDNSNCVDLFEQQLIRFTVG